MKKCLKGILTGILFLVGIAVMAYPFAGHWYNQRLQAEIIGNYDQVTDTLTEEEMEAERQSARAYNETLLGQVILSDPFDPNTVTNTSGMYDSLLNVGQDGMMGYIRIPAINVKLPIYHGTGSSVLEKGVGHLENTSLPVGGIATHAILSAHTGHPTAEFFNDLTKLQEGDLFYLSVLNETLAYQVDQIKVVEPSDTSDLRIDDAQDYVTLVTCTPYGVNSHRLLVRGVRTEYVEERERAEQEKRNDDIYWIAGLLCLCFVVVCMVIFLLSARRKKARRIKEK